VIGTGQGPHLLALVSNGDLMASTPIDFLLSGWNGVVDLMFARSMNGGRSAAGDRPIEPALQP
jgi:hypothetical protein